MSQGPVISWCPGLFRTARRRIPGLRINEVPVARGQGSYFSIQTSFSMAKPRGFT